MFLRVLRGGILTSEDTERHGVDYYMLFIFYHLAQKTQSFANSKVSLIFAPCKRNMIIRNKELLDKYAVKHAIVRTALQRWINIVEEA